MMMVMVTQFYEEQKMKCRSYDDDAQDAGKVDKILGGHSF